MRAASLRAGHFAVVHARFSAEKKKERGSSLPPLSDYLPHTEALLSRAGNATRVFLQTSTPEAVELFEKWSAERKWKLSYTQNERSTHDLWVTGSGKRSVNHTGERISVVAQTVNALIASRSRHFLSPSSSMWTWFIRALMGRQIDSRLSDTGGEQYEECIAQLQRSKESPDTSNMTLAEIKRCKKNAVPKLVSLHRSPSARGGDHADDIVL